MFGFLGIIQCFTNIFNNTLLFKKGDVKERDKYSILHLKIEV
jgi:hypothetical protein